MSRESEFGELLGAIGTCLDFVEFAAKRTGNPLLAEAVAAFKRHETMLVGLAALAAQLPDEHWDTLMARSRESGERLGFLEPPS